MSSTVDRSTHIVACDRHCGACNEKLQKAELYRGFFLLCVTHRSLWCSVGIKNSQEAINKYEAALNSEREAFYRNETLHLGLKETKKNCEKNSY